MKIKRNTEKAILMAFEEMIDAGLPVKEFDPTETDGRVSFDWVFERGLTPDEQRKAMSISSKWIDADLSFE